MCVVYKSLSLCFYYSSSYKPRRAANEAAEEKEVQNETLRYVLKEWVEMYPWYPDVLEEDKENIILWEAKKKEI